jgi:acyl-coenzyme A thioesterase PaaI-like protein
MNNIKIPSDVREWNQAGEGFLPGLLGIEFTDVGDDEVRARMAVPKKLLAWNGFMHGGSVVALADTACGYGTARDGFVECVATPVHRGRTTQVWDADVRVEGGDKTIATFRCTQLILR